jgi:hypothetical protein
MPKTARKYVRRIGRDVLHWCQNCRWYPRRQFVEVAHKGSWELCNECLSKEKRGKCAADMSE